MRGRAGGFFLTELSANGSEDIGLELAETREASDVATETASPPRT